MMSFTAEDVVSVTKTFGANVMSIICTYKKKLQNNNA